MNQMIDHKLSLQTPNPQVSGQCSARSSISSFPRRKRQGRCLTLPLFSFPRTNSESGHDRIKGTTLKQGGDLAFSLPEFLVCHHLLHPLFHGCQILQILKPAQSSYFAETVHVNAQVTTVFLIDEFGHLLCPLYCLWLFPWSNPCTSCPSNHVRTPFS